MPVSIDASHHSSHVSLQLFSSDTTAVSRGVLGRSPKSNFPFTARTLSLHALPSCRQNAHSSSSSPGPATDWSSSWTSSSMWLCLSDSLVKHVFTSMAAASACAPRSKNSLPSICARMTERSLRPLSRLAQPGRGAGRTRRPPGSLSFKNLIVWCHRSRRPRWRWTSAWARCRQALTDRHRRSHRRIESISRDDCFGEPCCSSLLHRCIWHRLCILHERGEVVGLANLVLFDGYGFDGWIWRHEPYSWMGRLANIHHLL